MDPAGQWGGARDWGPGGLDGGGGARGGAGLGELSAGRLGAGRWGGGEGPVGAGGLDGGDGARGRPYTGSALGALAPLELGTGREPRVRAWVSSREAPSSSVPAAS